MPLRGKQYVNAVGHHGALRQKQNVCEKCALFVLMASIRAAVGWERPWELSCLSLGSGSHYTVLPNRPACSSTQ